MVMEMRMTMVIRGIHLNFKEPSYTFVENGKRKNVEEFVKRFSFCDRLFVFFCVFFLNMTQDQFQES